MFEDDKIPTKKVKDRVKTLHLAVGLLHFHFFGRFFGRSCFSGTSTVETERGTIPIGNLRLGDNVLTYTPGKGGHYTEVKQNI